MAKSQAGLLKSQPVAELTGCGFRPASSASIIPQRLTIDGHSSPPRRLAYLRETVFVTVCRPDLEQFQCRVLSGCVLSRC